VSNLASLSLHRIPPLRGVPLVDIGFRFLETSTRAMTLLLLYLFLFLPLFSSLHLQFHPSHPPPPPSASAFFVLEVDAKTTIFPSPQFEPFEPAFRIQIATSNPSSPFDSNSTQVDDIIVPYAPGNKQTNKQTNNQKTHREKWEKLIEFHPPSYKIFHQPSRLFLCRLCSPFSYECGSVVF